MVPLDKEIAEAVRLPSDVVAAVLVDVKFHAAICAQLVKPLKTSISAASALIRHLKKVITCPAGLWASNPPFKRNWLWGSSLASRRSALRIGAAALKTGTKAFKNGATPQKPGEGLSNSGRSLPKPGQRLSKTGRPPRKSGAAAFQIRAATFKNGAEGFGIGAGLPKTGANVGVTGIGG